MPYFIKGKDGLEKIDSKVRLSRPVDGQHKTFAELEPVKDHSNQLKITLSGAFPDTSISWGKGFRQMIGASTIIIASDIIIEQGSGEKRRRYIVVFDARDLLAELELDPEPDSEIEYDEAPAVGKDDEAEEAPEEQEPDTSLNFGTLPRRRHP